MIERRRRRVLWGVVCCMVIAATGVLLEAAIVNAQKPPANALNNSKKTNAAGAFKGYVGRVVFQILWVFPPGAPEEVVQTLKKLHKQRGDTELKEGMLSPPTSWPGYVVIGNRSKSAPPGTPLKVETATIETIQSDGQFVIRDFPAGATTGQIYRDLGDPAPVATFHLSTLVPWGQVPKDIKVVVPMSMDPSGM